MPTPDAVPFPPADGRARDHVAANAAALGVAAPSLPVDVCWHEGRDTSVIGLRDCRWIGGTTMPRLVAEATTAVFAGDALPRGGSIGLIAPNTLHHALAVTHRLPAGGSVLAVWPDEEAMWLALAGADASRELAAGRLLVAAGADGVAELARRRRGWALPRTLHLPTDSEAVTGPIGRALIEGVRAALAAATAERSRELAEGRARFAAPTGRLLVVAGSGDSPWDLAGRALASAVDGDWVDTDDPRTSSPLALADAAAGASGVAACGLTRGDLPGVVPDSVPMVTWVATERPAIAPASAADAVVVADAAWQAAWVRAGWPEHRVAVAGWPTLALADQGGRGVLFAWPEREIDPPPSVSAYSSRQTTWNDALAELLAEPFRLTRLGGPRPYLLRRLKTADVELDEADVAMWLSRLVTPAFARGLARVARSLGATVASPRTPGELLELASSHAAIIDPTPGGLPATAALGLPVLSVRLGEEAFRRRVRRAEGERPGRGESVSSAVRRLLASASRARRAA